MHTDSDEHQHKHNDVHDVEGFVSNTPERQSRREHGDHGKASDDTHDLLQLEQIL